MIDDYLNISLASRTISTPQNNLTNANNANTSPYTFVTYNTPSNNVGNTSIGK